MDGPFRIRPATPADAPRLAALERECFSDPWSVAGLREALASDGGAGWTAEVAGRVEGYLLARVAADTAEVLTLAVAPAWRGRGIASLLLAGALGALRARGASEAYLEVRRSNLVAQALYQAHGFRVAGIRPAYYERPTEDALVLRRDLTEGA